MDLPFVVYDHNLVAFSQKSKGRRETSSIADINIVGR